MKRTKFAALLRTDRIEAVRFLASEIFDNHELQDMRSYWVRDHTGETAFVPFHSLSDEELLETADDSLHWDPEDSNVPGDCAECANRGWLLMDEESRGKLRIQRCDACCQFETDNEAARHVHRLASSVVDPSKATRGEPT